MADNNQCDIVYCQICGQEISREVKTLDPLGHDWSEWEEKDGKLVRT